MSKLTAAQRKRIEPRDYVDPKNRAFPINDETHARSALAEAHTHPELKAQIKAKVHAKYPGIKIAGEGEAAKARADKPKRASGGATLTSEQLKAALAGALGGFGGGDPGIYKDSVAGYKNTDPGIYKATPGYQNIDPGIFKSGNSQIHPDGTVSGFKRGGKVRKWRADGGPVDGMDQQPDPDEVKRWGSVQNAKAAADAQAYAKQRDRSTDFTGNNDWAAMGKPIDRQRGGRLKLDAGAGSGVGRLEQAEAVKKGK
jgi:hypothetical protein